MTQVIFVLQFEPKRWRLADNMLGEGRRLDSSDNPVTGKYSTASADEVIGVRFLL